MTSQQVSSHPGRAFGRLFAAGLAAALVLSTAPAARAAAPGAVAGTSTYTVTVTPADVTLCPGESEQVAVRVSRQVTRTARGRAVTGRPRDVRRARIEAYAFDPSIASVSPPNGQAVALQFASGARSQHAGAWFTVTGGKIGDSTIQFFAAGLTGSAGSTGATAPDGLARLDSRPSGQVAVHVRCKFRVTLTSTWTWSPGEITRTGYFTIPNVTLDPDSGGQFEVDAGVPSRNIRVGPCGGADTSGGGKAHFSGGISPDGWLNVNVTFSPLATTGTEGCKGKSHSGTAQVQPLTIVANVATGRRHFFFQIPHTVVADGASHISDTIINLTVLQ